MNFEIVKQEKFRRDELLKDKKELNVTLEKNIKVYENVCKIQAMFQETTNEIQNTLKYFLDDINQRALDITFPGYKFNMEFSIKNNVTHAGIFVENNGRKQKPMDSNGGGLGNIIAICSQMAAKKMCRNRDVIIADQPLKDLSKGEKEEVAVEMLKKITDELSLQYIMISHVDTQINSADKLVHVKLEFDEELGYHVSKVS